MTKIDIISGFLGAGKTTFIKKMIEEAFKGEQVVLIENEFGEVGIDGGFLKDAGIQITEMNSGCICCSLVGDFATNLNEVITKYHPDRILIEPSGVGKLSDVMKSVIDIEKEQDVKLNALVTVVNALKANKQMKAFGEFFNNQIEYATTVILSRSQNATPEQLEFCVKQIQKLNPNAAIITTDWSAIAGEKILVTMEGQDNLEMKVLAEARHAHDEHEHHHHDHEEHEHHHDHEGHEHHHEHDENCTCGCHDHDHEEHEHHHDHEEHEHHHDHEEHEHHHDHEEHEHDHDHEEHEHHHDHEGHEHHHEHDEDCTCGCHEHDHEDHEHHHDHEEHEHHHDHEDHEHHHDHEEHEHHHDHEEHEHHHDHEEHEHHHDHEDHEHHHDHEGHEHHHEHDENCTCGCHDHDHHHHHADDVFTSWGKETPHKFEKSKLEEILKKFVEDDNILRAKGMVESVDGTWIYFDMVPGEYEIREGEPDYTGRLVVIGTDIHEHELEEIFGIA